MEGHGKSLSPAGVLQHPSFSTVRWLMFLLLSGIMVLFNVYLQHWGIGTFDSISRFIVDTSVSVPGGTRMPESRE